MFFYLIYYCYNCVFEESICIWWIYIQVKRTLSQFTPANWDKDEWHPLLGPWRFIQVFSLCIVFMTVELNTFFLKFCLWIPPRNPLVVYRLILWWLIAVPTIREYNTYLQDRFVRSLKHFFSWKNVNSQTQYPMLLTENLWKRLEHSAGSPLPYV